MPDERQKLVKSSPIYGLYDDAVDRESACEKLAKRANEHTEAQEKADADKQADRGARAARNGDRPLH
jgi:hypothetical protein